MYTAYEKYALSWLDINTLALFSLIGSLFYLKNYYISLLQNSRSRLETVCDSLSSPEQLYNSQLINSTIHSVEIAKENLQNNLLSVIQIAESCIVWLIHTYKSTWRCLFHLAVQLVLSLVTRIVDPAQNIIHGVSSILNLPTTESNWTISLNSMQNNLDHWFENDKELIHQTINPLFQSLQSHVNSTFDSWQPPPFQFPNTPFLCNSTRLNAVMDRVENQVISSIAVAIGGVCILLLICILVNIVIIRFRFGRVAQAHALFIKQLTEESFNKYLWSSYSLIPWQKRNTPLHRFIHFMNHPMIMYCGIVGMGGLCLILLVAHLLETKIGHVYDIAIGELQDLVMNTTATRQFHEINEWIIMAELDLNQYIFGIIQSFAATINDTLTDVVNEIQNSIHYVLGGTLLETPVQELTGCLVINKIESVEQGLSWIANYSFIRLNRIDESSFEKKLTKSLTQLIDKDVIKNQTTNASQFYYMLVIMWCVALCIGVAFEIKYYFFGDSKKKLYIVK